MRLLFVCCFILLQACSTAQHVRLYQGPALADQDEVQLVLPLNFELLFLDNEEVSSFAQTFRNHTLTIKLAPGPHTLVLRYKDIWELDGENHDTLTSGQLTFDGTFEPGSTFSIHTPTLNTYSQAKAFVDQPKVKLVSAKQTLIASHTAKPDPLKFAKDESKIEVRNPNLQQLKFWWQQANEFEKKQFKQWLTSSNH